MKVGKIVFWVILALFIPSAAYSDTPRLLTVATDDWPPYEFSVGKPGNDHVSGFSTEVILAVFERMNIGIKDRIRTYPWARGERMVIEGTADVLYTAATNEKRAQITHYPDESLVESAWVFFIRKSDEGKLKFDSLDDLKGKKIGVVRAYAYTPEFWKFVEAEKNYDEVTHDEQNLGKLTLGRTDYVLMDYGNGMSLIRKMGLSDKVVPLKNPLRKISLFAIFSKNTVEKELVDRFSVELRKFKATEEYQSICKKYF